MTRRRWIADEVSGNHAALVGEHADHLIRVLRARVGQDFDIATGAAVRRGRITSLADDRVEFELAEEISAPDCLRSLCFSRSSNSTAWSGRSRSAPSLVSRRIVPVIARRTDSHLAAASAKRVERWQRIARQAAEQSRRAAPPEIAAPVKLSEALKLPAALRIVLAESEEQTLLCDVVNPDRS